MLGPESVLGGFKGMRSTAVGLVLLVFISRARAQTQQLGVARQFIKDHLAEAQQLPTAGVSVNDARLQHLLAAYKHVPSALTSGSSLHMEFGVREGTSFNFLAKRTLHLGATWDGFDSFQGLPKSSVAVGSGWRAGAFTTHGRMPEVLPNARLHPGWFNDSLPPFLDLQPKGKPVAFIHLDADIYESTWTVLENVCSRCLLRIGTVLSFDELFARKQKKLLDHEWLALRRASQQFGFEYHFITWMLHSGSPYGRVAVQVTSIDTNRCSTPRSIPSVPTPTAATPAPAPAVAAVGAPHLNARMRCGRKVFIDMGTNWCNTLQLYRELPNDWTPWYSTAFNAGTHRALTANAPWQVYGFEASSLIVPYAERCTVELSAGRPLPEPPVPPVGSGPELLRLASKYNCSVADKVPVAVAGQSPLEARWAHQKAVRATYQCIFESVRSSLQSLQPDPNLSNNPELLWQRVASAARCATGTHDEFTLVPAAASSVDGFMPIYGSLEDLITGGTKSVKMPGFHRGKVVKSMAPTVDVVRWMLRSFTPDDFVVLKMDIEGAEHSIIPALVAANASSLIDIFLWECHTSAGRVKCRDMESDLERAGVHLVYREPFKFRGKDERRVRLKTQRARFVWKGV